MFYLATFKICYFFFFFCYGDISFPGGSTVKNPPTMQVTWVLPLGQEDPLEKEMATHFSQYSCLGSPMEIYLPFKPYFWPCHCGILIPWPGIEPMPSAVKVQNPNHWTAREFPILTILYNSVILIAFIMLNSYHHYLVWKLLYYHCYRLNICWKFVSWNPSTQWDRIRRWGLQKVILIRCRHEGRILMGGTNASVTTVLRELASSFGSLPPEETMRSRQDATWKRPPPEYADGSDSKESACNWETWVQTLCWEDPLEESMTTHSSILAWRIPWTEEPGWLQSIGSQRVGHDWTTKHSTAPIINYLPPELRNQFLFKKLLYIGICPDPCVYAQLCRCSPLVSPALTGGFFTSRATRKAHFGV